MARRPNLSDEELDQIAALTEVNGWSVERIARTIGCSPGSVYWAQLRIGADKHPDKAPLDVPVIRKSYRRGGHTVVGYNQEDDDRLQDLALKGLSDTEIGARMEPVRQSNSIRGRLMTLARRQARAEARSAQLEMPTRQPALPFHVEAR